MLMKIFLVLRWSLGLWCDSGHVASLSLWEIEKGGVEGNTVIPDNNSLWLPLDTGMEVSSVCLVVEEELEEILRLFLLVSNDVSGDWDES